MSNSMPSPEKCIFVQVISDHIWSCWDPDLWPQNLISQSLSPTPQKL